MIQDQHTKNERSHRLLSLFLAPYAASKCLRPSPRVSEVLLIDYYPFGAPVQDRFESYELLETGNVTKVIDHHVEYTTYVYSYIDNGIVGDLELDANNGKWHAYATGYGRALSRM